MGEMRSQGERLARMEEREQKMEIIMAALQLRLEVVATKLECEPSVDQSAPRSAQQQPEQQSQELGAGRGRRRQEASPATPATSDQQHQELGAAGGVRQHQETKSTDNDDATTPGGAAGREAIQGTDPAGPHQ